MDLTKIKPKVIALLQNKVPVVEIANKTGVSQALIKEWSQNLTEKDLVKFNLNALAAEKAGQMLTKEVQVSEDKLKTTLIDLAYTLTKEVYTSLDDPELARAVHISADTICKIQSAFFSKGTQVAIVNDKQVDNEKLSTFKNALKD